MARRPLLTRILAILLLLPGLASFIPAFFPYKTLRTFLDGLSPDGTFNSLKAWNAGVFNILFGVLGVGFLVLAGITFFQRWGSLRSFLQRWWVDTLRSVRGLRIQKKEWGFPAVLGLITVMAVILRLEHAVSPMKHDEAYTYVAFGRSLFAALTDYHLPNNHVFHSVLVYFSTRLFGLAPWAVRLPAFTAGVLLVPAVYWLAARFYDRWTALAAAFLAAWFPALIAYANNARGYTLVALFSILLLALADVVRREKNLLAWTLIVLFSALGFLTLPVMLFPFGIVYVWLFLENLAGDVEMGANSYRTKGEFFTHWLASGFATAALTLLLFLPILIYTGAGKLFSNDFVAPVAWGDLLDTLFHRFGETWAEWTFRVPVFIIILLAVGWVLGLVFHRKVSRIKIPLQLAALLWITALILVQRPNAWSKVWVFLQPLMLLWAAAGLFGLLQKVRPRFSGGLPLSLAALGVILLAGLWQAVRLVPQLPQIWTIKGEAEQTALFVQGQLQGNELVAVAPVLDAPVWYYSELHGIPAAYFNTHDPEYQRLLVLVNLSEDQSLDSVLLDRNFDLQDLDRESARLLGTFGRVQVFEVQRKQENR